MLKSSRLIAVSLAPLLTTACGGGGGMSSQGSLGTATIESSATASTAPAASPSAASGSKTAAAAATTPVGGSRLLGVNISGHDYWVMERSFMNLTLGGTWYLVTPSTGWTAMPRSRIDSSGAVKSLAASETATLVISYPQPSSSGALFRCTWAGTGALSVAGTSVSNVVPGDHKFEFKWTLKYPSPDYAWLTLSSTKASDPLRNIDCREANASPTQMYSTEFLDSLRPFGVIRFLDWSPANQNTGGSWAKRTYPYTTVAGEDGVAVENMVLLLNQINADGWFTLPWNADDTYVTKFAKYVHDHMPRDRTVYVEVANEIWNGFPAGIQAEREGLAEGLGSPSNPFDVRMRRYGEKTNQVMRIWTKIYADRPTKLVRVIGSQAVNFGVTQAVLTYSDPNLIDAVAVAPYFGYDLFDDPATRKANTSKPMIALAIKADESIETMKRLKAFIAPYHKRLITYEGGQHVVTNDLKMAQYIERNSKMYDIYKRYLERWHNEVGDLMMLYASTSPISKYGSWGLREYNEQPFTHAATPKRYAAVRYAQTLAAQGH